MLILIVDAEIHIGVETGLPSGPRAVQGDRLDAFDLTETSGRLVREFYDRPYH